MWTTLKFTSSKSMEYKDQKIKGAFQYCIVINIYYVCCKKKPYFSIGIEETICLITNKFYVYIALKKSYLLINKARNYLDFQTCIV